MQMRCHESRAHGSPWASDLTWALVCLIDVGGLEHRPRSKASNPSPSITMPEPLRHSSPLE
jgi:hypothetical protein